MTDLLTEDLFFELEKLGIHPVRKYEPVPRLRTGLVSFDRALWGGIPKGLITEIWGPQKYGKTTSLVIAAGNIIRAGGHVLWVDLEHRMNHQWAKHWGADPETQMQLVSPKTGEEAFDIVLAALRNKLPFDMIVLDSIAGAFPNAYYEGKIGDSDRMASRATQWWHVSVLQRPAPRTPIRSADPYRRQPYGPD